MNSERYNFFLKATVKIWQLVPGACLGGGHWVMAPPLGRQDRIIA